MKLEHIKLAQEASSFNKFMAEMNDMRSAIHSTGKQVNWSGRWTLQLYFLIPFLCFPSVSQQTCLNEHLKRKFVDGAKERKELYNKVLELKG